MTTHSLKCIKAQYVSKDMRRIASRCLQRMACLGLLTVAFPGMARVLVVCVPENPLPPFVYSDRQSEVQALVREAVALQGDSAEFVRVPWARCRMGLKNGAYMAAMPMGANPQDLQDFHFPKKSGKVDEKLRVGHLTIGVVAREGSNVGWDGRSFSGLTSPVLVLPAQFVARNALSEMNIPQDAQAVHATSLLHMLVAGRRDAAVLPTSMVQQALASGEFPIGLKLFPLPLTKAPVYLSFNRAYEQAHPGYAQSIWDSYARLNATGRRSTQIAKVLPCQSDYYCTAAPVAIAWKAR